jgi:multidrug efflux pump subunit AcrA (membrane-fusion protein)
VNAPAAPAAPAAPPAAAQTAPQLEAQGAGPKRGRTVVGGAVLLLVAVAIGVASIVKDSGDPGEEIRVATSQRRAVTQKVLAQGKVRARTQVEVASEIGGRVSVVHVEVGDVVKKGDPLFALDDEQLKNAVEQLRVALAASEAMEKRASLGVTEADRAVQRDLKLRASGVVPEEQIKVSESRAQLARADLDQAKAGIDRTRLDLQRARDALRRAKVTAPNDGTVVAVGVEVGQVVSAVQGLTAGGDGLGGGALGFSSPSGGSGAPVILADLAELIVKLDVDELDVGLVKVGQRAVVRAQGIKDLAFDGVVERVGLMGRDQAGAVLFVVEVAIQTVRRDDKGAHLAAAKVDGAVDGPLPDARDILRPGMSAQADIEVQKLDDVIAVPVAAVLEGDGNEKPDRIFVYEGDITPGTSGRVREVRVKLGPTEGDAIAILSGLDDGAHVVEGPFRALKSLEDGDRVSIEVKKSDDDNGKKKAS